MVEVWVAVGRVREELAQAAAEWVVVERVPVVAGRERHRIAAVHAQPLHPSHHMVPHAVEAAGPEQSNHCRHELQRRHRQDGDVHGDRHRHARAAERVAPLLRRSLLLVTSSHLL